MDQHCDLQVDSDEEFDALAEAGVYTVGDLLDAAHAGEGLIKLSEKSGISAEKLHYYLVKSDLMRVKGMTTADADKLFHGKVSSVVDLASYDPEILIEDIRSQVAEEGFAPPSLEEAKQWVESAESIAEVQKAPANIFGEVPVQVKHAAPTTSVMFEPVVREEKELEQEEVFFMAPPAQEGPEPMVFDPEAGMAPQSEAVREPKRRYVPEDSREWMDSVKPLNPESPDGTGPAVRKREWMSRAEFDQQEFIRKHEKTRGIAMLVGVPILGVVVLFFVGWALFNMNAPSSQANESEMLLNLAEAERVARGFLAAETTEEKTEYVAFSEIVAPLMADYYKGEEAPSFSNVKSNGIIVEEYEGQKVYAFSMLMFPDLQGRRVVVRVVDGEHKVDWELSTWYQSMSLDEMWDKRPAEPVRLRVALERSFDQDAAFGSILDIKAYRMKLPRGMSSLLGHVKKDSSVYEYLESQLTPESPSLRAVVEVSYPENAASGDTVWLDSIVKVGWLTDKTLKSE